MAAPTGEQQTVIAHRGRPLVVVAGPGTGKTTTLVDRMISLLQEDTSREVSFVTFTRTSRRDTENRLKKAFGQSIFEQSQLLFPRTSTLHTYAKKLVHRYANAIGRSPAFTVLVEKRGEKAILLQEVVRDLGLDIGPGNLAEGISRHRCTKCWPVSFPLSESDRTSALKHFELLLAFYNTFDMEGIVVAACRILDGHASNLPPLFLQIDEYQDLNPIDQLFVQLAASNPSSQVVVVGDDAQSIYGFRHANYQGLRSLWQDPSWDKIPFSDSHRLPPHILNAALELIAGQGYLGAEMNRKPPDSKRLLTYQCTKSNLQIKAVANYIRQKMEMPVADGKAASRFKDFLVLCPTTRFVDTTVGQLTQTYGIPAQKPTASRIPDAYWSLLLVLRMAHTKDPLALRQWLPILGFSEDEIHCLRLAAMQSGKNLFEHCQAHNDHRLHQLFDQLSRLIEASTNLATLRDALDAFHNLPPQCEFAEFLSSRVSEDDLPIPSFGHLIQLIYERFGLIDSDEELPTEDKAIVATLHTAKGLEAEYVCCMWMNARFMPMDGRDREEERRVLYVALTRAKKDVLLTFHEEYDHAASRRIYENALSPFLLQIRNHLNIVRCRAGDLR